MEVKEVINNGEQRPTAYIIVGGAWGDEGKGKVASWAAQNADLVIRATGGANAGHTVEFRKGNSEETTSIALHLIPGGIVYPHTTCLIGQGVVIDIKVLLDEIKMLEELGVPNVRERLYISGRAHVVFPYHKSLDILHEMKKDKKIGTTKRGIGPCYADKDNRVGIRIYDLLLPYEKLAKKIDVATRLHNQAFLENKMEEAFVCSLKLAQEYEAYENEIKNMVVDADHLVENFRREAKQIAVEGAQAYRLDKDYGDYPNVTSSNCVTAGTLIGAHLNHKDVKEVIVITKAHFSRVGNGPFPTEQPAHVENDNVIPYEESEAYVGDIIREMAHEYGATTKRPRRCGWFDGPLVKSSKAATGADYLCINHLDTLGKLGNKLGYIRICTSYKYQGEVIDYYPDDIEFSGELPEAIYHEIKGGWDVPKGLTNYEDLPEQAKEFVRIVETVTEIPVKYIGIGPKNEDLIVRNV